LSDELGVSKSTVSRHVRDGKVDIVRAEQVSQAIKATKEVSSTLDAMNGGKP
jgi:predicted site-specific integrase-resolvase